MAAHHSEPGRVEAWYWSITKGAFEPIIKVGID